MVAIRASTTQARSFGLQEWYSVVSTADTHLSKLIQSSGWCAANGLASAAIFVAVADISNAEPPIPIVILIITAFADIITIRVGAGEVVLLLARILFLLPVEDPIQEAFRIPAVACCFEPVKCLSEHVSVPVGALSVLNYLDICKWVLGPVT